ncbi:hypothetical protein C0J52_15098 [Blattella germanica]|nr:hypothetical protein C0J52_15098 [Blattella germanica]
MEPMAITTNWFKMAANINRYCENYGIEEMWKAETKKDIHFIIDEALKIWKGLKILERNPGYDSLYTVSLILSGEIRDTPKDPSSNHIHQLKYAPMLDGKIKGENTCDSNIGSVDQDDLGAERCWSSRQGLRENTGREIYSEFQVNGKETPGKAIQSSGNQLDKGFAKLEQCRTLAEEKSPQLQLRSPVVLLRLLPHRDLDHWRELMGVYEEAQPGMHWFGLLISTTGSELCEYEGYK